MEEWINTQCAAALSLRYANKVIEQNFTNQTNTVLIKQKQTALGMNSILECSYSSFSLFCRDDGNKQRFIKRTLGQKVTDMLALRKHKNRDRKSVV